jgi:ParB-like chromosome segregation protein Spo0J
MKKVEQIEFSLNPISRNYAAIIPTNKEELVLDIQGKLSILDSMSVDEKVETINAIKLLLKEHSPFKTEPVDCVIWVKNNEVQANDYNPNSVAPPEMELLRQSIGQDGYTQPIVSWFREGIYEVVDGFHRNRVGREYKEINERVHGYLPLTVINNGREDLGDRMAATIRHNRARGKHKVEAMSDIVIELKRRNWSDEKIAKNLGMDADEVLRLTQITGLAEMFADRDFSEAWEVDQINEDDNLEISEEE